MKFSNSQDKQKFHDLLAEGHEWPCDYLFKFIIPTDQVSIFKTLFEEDVKFLLKPSSAGKYTSVNISLRLSTPAEVIEIYERVAVIKGLLAL